MSLTGFNKSENDDNFVENCAPFNYIEEAYNAITDFSIINNFAQKSSFNPYSSHSISTIKVDQDNNKNNFNNTNKNNFINNASNFNNFQSSKTEKLDIPDFYKMIEEEKSRREVKG